MRTSVVPTLARWLSPLVALSVLGCPKQELAPLGPCTVSAVSERVDQSGVSDVDLLFVIDNSGSMASEQLKLAAQLPNLVRVLTSGDRYPGVPDDMLPAGVTPETRKFTPVKTLHLGVVSTNAGGIDDPSARADNAAIVSCVGEGDDGKLQNSTTIAVEGVRAAYDEEFKEYDENEVVLTPRPECGDLIMPPTYQEFEAGTTDTPVVTAAAFSCVSALGVRGCPFEQQLESMWKALAPSQGIGDPALFTFINGTRGQGDRYNKGFLREEAILAVLIVTDEEDCSITDAGKELFPLLARDLNVRCGFAADDTDLVQSPQRYVAGLKSLKPANPDRIVFGVIAGIPEDAITSQQTIQEILQRDDMTFRSMTDPATKNELPVPSCTTTTNGKTDQAYPPRRMLQVAQGFPEQSVIYSICSPNYGPALDLLIEKIASKLRGNCLPRVLNPGDDGLVNCEVFELLPVDDEDDCPPEFGLEGEPIERELIEEGVPVKRRACKMKQLAVTGNNEIEAGNGWYYDYFSDDLKMDCNPGEQQRIAFSFANGNTTLPSGAGATFECFQPVARIDNDAKGFDAVNTRCSTGNEPNDTICTGKSTEDYALFCQADTLSCQITCENNPDCPPGWICQPPLSGDDIRSYCQLPTCPQDSSSNSGT